MIKLKEILGTSDLSHINYDIEEDLWITVQGIIPMSLDIEYGNPESVLKFFKIEKDPTNPYQFHVKCTANGKTIEFDATKTDRWRSHWSFKMNGESISKDKLEELGEKTFLTPFEQMKYNIEHHDFSYDYADDQRSWAGGVAHKEYMRELYKNLTPQEKKEAWKLWNKTVTEKFRDGMKYFGFEKFSDFNKSMSK